MVIKDAEKTDGFLDDCAYMEDELVYLEALTI